jgi:hypothetical protein
MGMLLHRCVWAEQIVVASQGNGDEEKAGQ